MVVGTESVVFASRCTSLKATTGAEDVFVFDAMDVDEIGIFW